MFYSGRLRSFAPPERFRETRRYLVGVSLASTPFVHCADLIWIVNLAADKYITENCFIFPLIFLFCSKYFPWFYAALPRSALRKQRPGNYGAILSCGWRCLLLLSPPTSFIRPRVIYGFFHIVEYQTWKPCNFNISFSSELLDLLMFSEESFSVGNLGKERAEGLYFIFSVDVTGSMIKLYRAGVPTLDGSYNLSPMVVFGIRDLGL